MEYTKFKEKFVEELNKNNINNVENVNKYFEYMNILLDWNTKINLTAIKNEDEFIVKHFIDSLTITKYINNNSKIIDVGTGAGFPGIPLKLFNEDFSITLIDSVNKKINVLKDVINKLQLSNIEAIHTRAEEFAIKNREKYDVSVSRAVANMTTLVEYLIPFVRVGGNIICMKGPNFEKELDEAKNAIQLLGGKIDKIEKKILSEELERNIIIIKKIKETPKQYPRGQSKPLKEPLK